MATKAWREANVDKLRKYRKDHYARNRSYYIFKSKEYKQDQKEKDGDRYRAKCIVENSRYQDKKARRENDLDLEFVVAAIKDGCTYCGSQSLMVMDRINNDLGHIKTNVNAACFRCNDIRCNMPYAAWIVIAPAIRLAHETGLFGNWKQTTSKTAAIY